MDESQLITDLRIRWDSLSSPIRPNDLDIAWYRSQLPESQSNRALLLGATPEIRDMFSELGYDTFALDINKTNYEAMSGFRRSMWGRETYVRSDWLEERPEFVGAFDAVVGDGVFLYLPFPSEAARLLTLLGRYLRSEGRVLIRQVFLGPLDPLKLSLERVTQTERPSKTLLSSVLMSLIVQSAGLSGTVDPALMGRLAGVVTEQLTDNQREPFRLHFSEFRSRYQPSIYDDIPPPISVPTLKQLLQLLPDELDVATIDSPEYFPELNYKRLAFKRRSC